MNIKDLFLDCIIEKQLVFKEKDYINFYDICNKKPDIDNFAIYKNNLDKFNYKISRTFFGTELFHPKSINPHKTKYDLSKIMFDLKLNLQKIKDNQKLDKLINYIKYLS